jgi:hypothetical protein
LAHCISAAAAAVVLAELAYLCVVVNEFICNQQERKGTNKDVYSYV